MPRAGAGFPGSGKEALGGPGQEWNNRYMHARRDELLQGALAYFLDKGLAELSLRPLAEALGTSARMLLYHFGSKEGLITAVMDEVNARFQTAFTDLVASRREDDAEPMMLTLWNHYRRPENLPCLRLAYEVQILALQNPAVFGRYQDHVATSWQDLIERALPPSPGRQAMATLCAGAFDGLMLNLLATGDAERSTAALKLFTELLAADPAHMARLRPSSS